MKTYNLTLRKTALAAAVVLLVGGVSTMNDPILGGTGYGWMSSAYAAEDGSGKGSGGKKGAMGEGRGGQGAKGAGGAGHRGGKSVKDVLSDDDDGDDTSDRPPWAGVPGGEDRPGGGGNPNPGDTKGDEFGDMIVLVRDPETGEPIKENGELLVCIDPSCSYADDTTWVAMVDGEVPAGTATLEVDLGRASLVRMPTSVMDRRLTEAITLIESGDISQDDAGRIVVTVGDVEKTIDSPLENLALYIDLMEGLADGGSATVTALGSLATLDTAASLLGAVADKTGDISLDYYMAVNMISDLDQVEDPPEYYDLGTFMYDRDDFSDVYRFLYSPDGDVAPVWATMDIGAYLDHVNDAELPTGSAALFATAADDALEVVELLHTQVVTDEFLNGFEDQITIEPQP